MMSQPFRSKAISRKFLQVFFLLLLNLFIGSLLSLTVGCGVRTMSGKLPNKESTVISTQFPSPTQPNNTPGIPGDAPGNPGAPGSPGDTPGNPADAQEKREYTPFVHTGYSEYIFNSNPESTKVLHSNGETIITTSHGNFSLEKIKLFMPPGTKRFYAKFQTYLSPTEAKAAVRFGALPVKKANDVNTGTSFTEFDETLGRLLAGEELAFYCQGGCGALSISAPNSFDDAKAAKGGYIYIHLLSIPGGKILSIQTRMIVDEACYRSWYANAKWDAQGNPDENVEHTCSGSR